MSKYVWIKNLSIVLIVLGIILLVCSLMEMMVTNVDNVLTCYFVIGLINILYPVIAIHLVDELSR